MALFSVPGWSVPDAPVSGTLTSRKRKRTAPKDEDKVESATVNFEKLLAKLEGGENSTRRGPPKRQKSGTRAERSGKQTEKSGGMPHVLASGAEQAQKDVKRKEKKDTQTGPSQPAGGLGSSKKSKKKGKRQTESGDQQGADAVLRRAKETPEPKGGLTTLQAGMKNSLEGARFRWINELLYKSNSEDAHELMRENPQVYEEYHTGFRHQVHSWPTNPVSYYVSSLSAYPQKTIVADLGCGDAALARALIPQGMTVLSFDLVSDGIYVVEADICGHLPLPGSEGSNTEDREGASEGEGAVVDVVVCALSLMGTNWPTCIREAWRILKPGGELKIAEVASRFTAVDDFVALVSSVGFRLKSKDDRNTHFTLFEFKKVARKTKSPKEWDKLVARGSVLKPCEYKRR